MLTCTVCSTCIEKDHEIVSDSPLLDAGVYCSSTCAADAMQDALAEVEYEIHEYFGRAV